MSTKHTLLRQSVAEFMGIALFIFFGTGCVAALKLGGAQLGLWEISIIWGFGVALAIYLTAGVSGAHLNPAVTIALCFFSNFDVKKAPAYILAQVAGAFFGASIVYVLYYNLFLDYEETNQIIRGSISSLDLTSIFSTYPNAKMALGQAFATEFVITLILMCLIFAIGDDNNGLPRGPLAPILVGILIAVIGGSMGPLTGFAMNPARDFGPKLFTYFAGYGGITFTGGKEIPYFLIPIVAPVLGALTGGIVYRYFISYSLPKKN